MCTDNFKKIQYYLLSLDPIHVGTGGARLGRVDLPIIREPGTNLPKIPATSLSGTARAYTAISTNKYCWKENGIEYSCAGRGGDGGEKHCGRVNPACPVCVPYGFSKGSGNSIQGLAQFFDAHILFFPVSTMIGPVWLTSPMALDGLGMQQSFSVDNDKFWPIGSEIATVDKLNFGWLMLEKGTGSANLSSLVEIPDTIRNRVALVSNKLFSQIVNSNLEVRTSVSIDPLTGAAEERALFIYEAIPRGTVFKLDIVYNSGKILKVGGQELKAEGNADVGIDWIKTNVEKGLKLFETLGIGGMNTRGMGRVKILNLT